jgi:hypothetical protein
MKMRDDDRKRRRDKENWCVQKVVVSGAEAELYKNAVVVFRSCRNIITRMETN